MSGSFPQNENEIAAMVTVPRYAPRPKPTPIPGAKWNDSPCYCLAVNGEWLSHILGVLIALDQPDTWIGNEAEVEDARQQVNEIIACFMKGNEMCCCGGNQPQQPVLRRVTTDGQMQVSYDGGVTWVQDQNDPRIGVIQLPAPIPGGISATKCDAATNGLEHLQDVQEQTSALLGTGLGVMALAAAVAGILIAAAVALELLSVGLLTAVIVPVIVAAMQAIAGLTPEVYDAMFTNEVWDKMLCILYCRIGEDGQFDQAGFDAVLSDVRSKIPGEASKQLAGMIAGWQLPMLNNACSYGNAGDADCSSCDCTCGSDWIIDPAAAVFYSGMEITEVGENYLIVKAGHYNDGSTDYYRCYVRSVGGTTDCCQLTNFDSPRPPFELVSGGTDGFAVILCGHEPDDYSGLYAGACVWNIQVQCNVPDTQVRINFNGGC